MSKAISMLAITALVALGLYAAILAWLWFRQEKLLFFPEPLPADYVLAREPGIAELRVPVQGAELSVLQLRLPASRGVVFFLHGNGGNLASWFTNADFYRQVNFDLVMLDYRGYGKSTGRIESVTQLRADVRAVWQRFAPDYEGRKIVVYGRSLGSGLAAELAADLSAAGTPPDLTVLVSPYLSLRELTTEFYPWVPSALLRYPIDTAGRLPEVRGPVFLLHGERDELISASHSRRLRQRVPQARLLVVPGAGHNDVHEFPVYRQALREALTQL